MRRSHDSFLEILRRGDFGSVSDELAIRRFGHQFFPELKRLQGATSTIETSDSITKGDLDGRDLTPSRLLFDQDFPEVNRTLVSVLALKWLYAGDYDSFTKGQPEAARLKVGSFQALRHLAIETLPDTDHLLALLVAIVVGDLGKDPKLARDVRDCGSQSAEFDNHDKVVYGAATSDILAPLHLLLPALREDVIAGLKLGSKLNIPQLAQAENVPGSLKGVLQLQGQERAFEIKYLEVLLDVAGAGGHIDSRGAIRMTEPVYQAFTVGRAALLEIIAGTSSLREGYDRVLQYRNRLLNGEGFEHLSITDSADRALLRLFAMGRITEKRKADLFEKAFSGLPQSTKSSLVSGMNVDGYNDGEAIILYYMPALFAEALRTTKDSSEEATIQALSSLMRFMTRAYRGSRPQPGKPGNIIECDLSFVQEIIGTDAFKADPKLLDSLAIPNQRGD